MNAVFGMKSFEVEVPENDHLGKPGFKSMIAAYHKHSKKLKTAGGDTLKGIVLSRNDLETLLERHKDDATDIMLIFAVDSDDLVNVQDPDRRAFTVLLASIKKDTNGNNRIDDGMVMNRYKPCPDDCAQYDSVFPQSI